MPDLTTGGMEMQARHLDRVRDLIRNIEAAISALERNNLQDFQSALRNQEAICSELVAITQTSVSQSKNAPDAELTAQLQRSYKDLAQVNRVYVGVVKRAKRWIDLLSRLYGLQRERYEQPLCLPAEQQTLSCEV
jgi:hypothetical protein